MTNDADPQTIADTTTSFLKDHDHGEQALETVLEVDAASETWTFDDVAFDSRPFGELVSRGIVEKIDGEYRVADVALKHLFERFERLDTDLSDHQPLNSLFGLESFPCKVSRTT